MAIKDLLKPANPINVKGAPIDAIINEFKVDKEMR
jgi:hypothetical protein